MLKQALLTDRDTEQIRDVALVSKTGGKADFNEASK